jgi:hypothetical protein
MVGVVVPTIGQRPQYIEHTLKSIREAGKTFVVLVGRKDFDGKIFSDLGLVDMYIDEESPSLPNKINQGFRAMPKDIEYITWVGDDDLLFPDALVRAVEVLSGPEEPVLVFGHCQYIDSEGKEVFVKRTGPWAVHLLRFGPQLIPQPSATFRRAALEMVGGLSGKYQFAFDFDLFIKLCKSGKSIFIDEITSGHRLHQTSLTLSRRWESVREASAVRVSHYPRFWKYLSLIWEIPVILVTYISGSMVGKSWIQLILSKRRG